MKYCSAKLNGEKVWVKFTDPSRPTCGVVMNEVHNFKLVTTCELTDIEMTNCGASAMKKGC